MATVIIPTPLRKFTREKSSFETNSKTVIDALKEIGLKHPGIKPHLLSENSSIRPFINIFVDDVDIRGLDNESTSLKENSVVALIPAIAGGKA